MRLAYTAGAIVGTGALGVVLLAIRAAGSRGGLGVPAAGSAHDHAAAAAGDRDHRSTCCGLFELPVLGGRAQPAGSFGTGALAAFVATPCAGPFLGAALGTALAAAGGGIGAGVRRARAWAWRCRSASSRSFPALRSRLAEARPLDGTAAALPRDPDGGSNSAVPSAAPRNGPAQGVATNAASAPLANPPAGRACRQHSGTTSTGPIKLAVMAVASSSSRMMVRGSCSWNAQPASVPADRIASNAAPSAPVPTTVPAV